VTLDYSGEGLQFEMNRVDLLFNRALALKEVGRIAEAQDDTCVLYTYVCSIYIRVFYIHTCVLYTYLYICTNRNVYIYVVMHVERERTTETETDSVSIVRPRSRRCAVLLRSRTIRVFCIFICLHMYMVRRITEVQNDAHFIYLYMYVCTKREREREVPLQVCAGAQGGEPYGRDAGRHVSFICLYVCVFMYVKITRERESLIPFQSCARAQGGEPYCRDAGRYVCLVCSYLYIFLYLKRERGSFSIVRSRSREWAAFFFGISEAQDDACLLLYKYMFIYLSM